MTLFTFPPFYRPRELSLTLLLTSLFVFPAKQRENLPANKWGRTFTWHSALGFKDETHTQEAVRLKVNLFLSSLKRDEQKQNNYSDVKEIVGCDSDRFRALSASLVRAVVTQEEEEEVLI